MFGYVACRTTGKITGCGGAERNWADCKELKSGKRSHIGSDKLMKQATLYTSSNLRQARIKKAELERLDCNNKEARWGDEDEQFDLGLEKWNVDTDDLKKPAASPRRRFRCWIEDWENVLDKGAVMRQKFLEKYGGLVFDDVDCAPVVRMTISKNKMKYIKRSGWHVIAEPPECDGDDDDLLEPIKICEDVLLELIKKTDQPAVLNVLMVTRADEENGSEDDNNEVDDIEDEV